jgi:hypothetical protein
MSALVGCWGDNMDSSKRLNYPASKENHRVCSAPTVGSEDFRYWRASQLTSSAVGESNSSGECQRLRGGSLLI